MNSKKTVEKYDPFDLHDAVYDAACSIYNALPWSARLEKNFTNLRSDLHTVVKKYKKRSESETIRIVACAIKYRGITYALAPPAHHHDVIEYIARSLKLSRVLYEEQGFLDNNGKFHDRVTAMAIAQKAGQLLNNRAPVLEQLFSENLW